MTGRRFRIETLRVEPLSVRLTDPFVIASGRVDVTPNVLVEVEVLDLATGARATGFGEAATLPPVTKETQADVLARHGTAPSFAMDDLAGLEEWVAVTAKGPVARAGFSTAVTDAFARLRGVPVFRLLGGSVATIATNMTIPIGARAHMVNLARGWAAKGFRCFKVKVGRDADADLRALEGIHDAVPGCTFRIDANAGFSSTDALRVGRELVRLGLQVECFEQPCGAEDLDGLARVTEAFAFDVVADESCQGIADVEGLAGIVDGVNLKLAKMGSLEAALAAGQRARELGLSIMVGSMVETRLGVTAAAHLACAIGGVEYPDLDTAWLLAEDPFVGGYVATGPDYVLPETPGLGIARRT